MQYLTKHQSYKNSRRNVQVYANSNNDEGGHKSRTYLNGMLQRAYRGPKKDINSNMLVQAMLERWTRAYRLSITTNDNCLAIKLYPDELDRNLDTPELDLVAEVLNTYGLAFHFVDHIKYDLSLCDPRTNALSMIDLGVPIVGSRTIEWDLHNFK